MNGVYLMDSKKVIAAISRISRKKPEDIQGHLSLSTLGLNGSFGLSALRSLLEAENNTKLPPINGNMTVDNLIDLLTGSSRNSGMGVSTAQKSQSPNIEQPAKNTTNRLAQIPMNFGQGIDIQEIGELPLASDYRTNEFYSSNFAPSEIATAVLRPDPRAHLCGIFCAKEAAKKSHPTLLNLRMNDFIVHHDTKGRPLLSLSSASFREMNFQFQLSISHTSLFAVASCITFWSTD
jgi:holo-[acyl-carrier protein] synthase